ncbi:hypothetical protein E1B28_006971 [Marasmius oreades]|uniref:Uncharacterized protein n=1 Tax=Marasmius oreades TaxID=181124 RepID=A0A9P7UVG0_9AGAR|nr:uncharacterized protein E1B28_006971 [Marasmius oreades]KAG7093289.1 hypothetical protein E1B28_006971 [Marasmius oreades]
MNKCNSSRLRKPSVSGIGQANRSDVVFSRVALNYKDSQSSLKLDHLSVKSKSTRSLMNGTCSHFTERDLRKLHGSLVARRSRTFRYKEEENERGARQFLKQFCHEEELTCGKVEFHHVHVFDTRACVSGEGRGTVVHLIGE